LWPPSPLMDLRDSSLAFVAFSLPVLCAPTYYSAAQPLAAAPRPEDILTTRWCIPLTTPQIYHIPPAPIARWCHRWHYTAAPVTNYGRCPSPWVDRALTSYCYHHPHWCLYGMLGSLLGLQHHGIYIQPWRTTLLLAFLPPFPITDLYLISRVQLQPSTTHTMRIPDWTVVLPRRIAHLVALSPDQPCICTIFLCAPVTVPPLPPHRTDWPA